MTIDERIEQLDLSLFSHVHNETTEEDKRTLLALQIAFRQRFPGYVYLEIGSYKGGSIQQHVVDDKCGKIISIDPRPESAPYPGGSFKYPETTTESMLASLKQIPGADISKIKTFEASTSGLSAEAIGVRPQLCFVDGEHTDKAALADGRFCLSVLAENGAIAFHDANMIYGGLRTILAELTACGRVFRAQMLPDSIFLIEVGSIDFCATEPLRGRVRESYKAYLAGMLANDMYVQAYPLSVARAVRAVQGFYQELLIYRALRKVKRILFRRSASKT
jgi:hypothetical protein